MSESKPKFTPGPWRRTITTVPSVSEGYDISPNIVNLTIGDRNIPLAAIGMNSTAETMEFFWKMVANAALIAAAPDMYELLDRIKGILEKCRLENSIDAEAEHEIDRLLAKARGEDAE